MAAFEEADAVSEITNTSKTAEAPPELGKKASLKDRRRASLIRRQGLSAEEQSTTQNRSISPPRDASPFVEDTGRDRARSLELRNAAQRRLEVKIRARKVLAKNAELKERSNTTRADLVRRISTLSQNSVLVDAEHENDNPVELSHDAQISQETESEIPGEEGTPTLSSLSPSADVLSMDSFHIRIDAPKEPQGFAAPVGLSKEGQARLKAARERRMKAEAEVKAAEKNTSAPDNHSAEPASGLTGAL